MSPEGQAALRGLTPGGDGREVRGSPGDSTLGGRRWEMGEAGSPGMLVPSGWVRGSLLWGKSC